jgi:hypothetical protein
MRAALALAPLLVVACAASTPPAETSPPTTAAAATTPNAQFVNATILTNRCQELGRARAKLAETAMYQLVEACKSVPGGSAQFEATLQPGGRIDITAAPGQPDVVPVCILKHSLMHKVPLAKPCRLEVKIEQTSVPMALDAGAGAGGGAS